MIDPEQDIKQPIEKAPQHTSEEKAENLAYLESLAWKPFDVEW